MGCDLDYGSEHYASMERHGKARRIINDLKLLPLAYIQVGELLTIVQMETKKNIWPDDLKELVEIKEAINSRLNGLTKGFQG